MMSYSRRSKYSHSPSPIRYSRSRSLSRSHSGDISDVENPGNNLYVTGLSPRITKRDLEKHFSAEGTVIDIHLVVDPWTKESRGFGFVTMSTVEEANRCIKYLHRSVLEGRVITVEKAKRRRGRTPTPGRYLGVKTIRVRRRSPSYSPYHRRRHGSPRYSGERERSESPYYRRRRHRSRSVPHRYSRHRRHDSYSPDQSRSYSRSPSPYYHRRHRSISPYERSSRYRSESPYYRSSRHYRSVSRSPSRGRNYSRSRNYSRGRSGSRSVSDQRKYSRDYSRSPHLRRGYSRSRSVSHSSSRSH